MVVGAQAEEVTTGKGTIFSAAEEEAEVTEAEQVEEGDMEEEMEEGKPAGEDMDQVSSLRCALSVNSHRSSKT